MDIVVLLEIGAHWGPARMGGFSLDAQALCARYFLQNPNCFADSDSPYQIASDGGKLGDISGLGRGERGWGGGGGWSHKGRKRAQPLVAPIFNISRPFLHSSNRDTQGNTLVVEWGAGDAWFTS